MVSILPRAEAGSPRPAMVHGLPTVQRHASAGSGDSRSTAAGASGLSETGRNGQPVFGGDDRSVHRVIATAATDVGRSRPAALPQQAVESGRQRSPVSNPDVNGMVDQVYQMLVRRLASERMRKGL
jgi:hypothetical protein